MSPRLVRLLELVLVAVAWLVGPALAATVDLSGSNTLRVPTGTSLPATCTVGDIFADTDATAGQNLYLCTAANTWTLQGGGGGGGGVTADTAQRAAFYNTTTTVDGAPALTFASDGTTIISRADRITTVSASATLGTADGPVVACTSGASDVTLTLPAGATTTQRQWTVVKVDSGAGRCLVDATGTETINGATGTLAAATQWSRVDLALAQTSGTPNWSGVLSKTAIDLTTDVTGILPSANGGTGSSTAPPVRVASGTATLGTSAIASGACATAVTVAATGVATTDTITFTPNADITAVTGYAPVTTGGLAIYPYPTANNVSFRVCNPTSASMTPGAVTLNWRVIR